MSATLNKSLLPKNAFTRITIIQSLLMMVALTALGLGTKVAMKQLVLSETEQELHDLLEAISIDMPEKVDDEWCLKHTRRTSFRLTVVAAHSGKVLCDSYFPASGMKPLDARPEIMSATAQGFGTNIRFSSTLSEDAFYGAKYLKEHGIIVRAGTKLSQLRDTFRLFDIALFSGLGILGTIIIGILAWSSRRLIFPMAEHVVTETTHDMRVDFVANVSHELRTPLTAIKGFADTLSNDITEGRPAEPEFVTIISRNATRLLTLINDLLDLSSMDSRALKLNRSHVATEEVTQSVIKQLSGVLSEKQQKISVQTNATQVYADPVRLEQVLINLIDNARKYSPESSQIHVVWENHGSGDVILKVSDNGPGIAEEHQARLFERFYRVDTSRSRTDGEPVGGTGLGLSIVKHIVELHGGDIGVESKLGQGSTFWVKFPKN